MTHRSNAPLAWSVVAICLTLGVVLLNLPAVARAALQPRASAREDLLAEATAMLDKYAEAESTYIARFKGRSAFLEPPQPRTSKTPIMDPPIVEPAPEPEQPEPLRRPDYKAIGGRPLIRLHSDLAVFEDGTRLHVGEQESDLTLLEVHAPWSARVKLRDWEYEVELFERSHGEAFFDREDELIESSADQVTLAPIATPATASADVVVEDESTHVTPRGEDLDDPADPPARSYGGRVPELLDAAQIKGMTHQELIGYASELSTARRSWQHNARTPEDQRILDRIDQAWQAVTARLRQLRQSDTSRKG